MSAQAHVVNGPSTGSDATRESVIIVIICLAATFQRSASLRGNQDRGPMPFLDGEAGCLEFVYNPPHRGRSYAGSLAKFRQSNSLWVSVVKRLKHLKLALLDRFRLVNLLRS